MKTITQLLSDAFDEVDQFLNERLDKLVERFRTENPGFVSDYENARRIVDAGASRTTKKLPAANSATPSVPKLVAA